jgi:hypothetical protein
MIWAILVIGQPSAELIHYLRTKYHRFVISTQEINPFDAHEKYPGFDYLVYWHSALVPSLDLPALDTFMDFSKVNVTWDSYGRNYPHKTQQRFSTDFIGLPKNTKAKSLEMLEVQDLYILPKDLNVQEGYAETKGARLKNTRKRNINHSLPYVKIFDPQSGRYI